MDFGDGTSAEVQMPDFWKSPEVGSAYVLVLKGKGDGTFSLVGGPQGLFKLTGGAVVPQVRAEDKLMQAYGGKSEASFLEEIRGAVEQK